mgnify:CR=1 FL=1
MKPPLNVKPQPIFNKTLLIIMTVAAFLAGIGILRYYYFLTDSSEEISQNITQQKFLEEIKQTSPLPADLPQPQNNSSSAPAQAAQNFPSVQTPTNEINAQFFNTIDLNYQFTLKEYPETQFKIIKITKAWGGIPIRGLRAPCNYLEQDKPIFIFIKDASCLETSKQTDKADSALVVAYLEINNNGPANLYGKFLQIMYDITDNGKTLQHLAAANPNLPGYETAPLSSKNVLVGFIIPEIKNEITLLYGNYGTAIVQKTDEDFFSKTINGLIINFNDKTFSEIPG